MTKVCYSEPVVAFGTLREAVEFRNELGYIVVT